MSLDLRAQNMFHVILVMSQLGGRSEAQARWNQKASHHPKPLISSCLVFGGLFSLIKFRIGRKNNMGGILGKHPQRENDNTPSGKLTYRQGESTFCPGIYHQNSVDFLAIAMLVDQSVLPVGSRQIKRFGSRAWLKLLKPKLRSEVRRLESGKGCSKESSRNRWLLHSLE